MDSAMTISEREHAKAVADYLEHRSLQNHSALYLAKHLHHLMTCPTYRLQDLYLVTIQPDLLEKAFEDAAAANMDRRRMRL
jgi:hypothetical protein